MVDQCPVSKRKSRFITFQVSMSPEMVDEIEAIARDESHLKKKYVSRSAKIRDFCRECIDRLQTQKNKGDKT